MANLIWIFLGGGLGSLARFGVGYFFIRQSENFPWGTLVANIAASMLAGFLLIYTARHHSPESIRTFGMIGFCGGFSTFSTFSLESYQMIQDGQWITAALYIAASVAACVIGIGISVYLFK